MKSTSFIVLRVVFRNTNPFGGVAQIETSAKAAPTRGKQIGNSVERVSADKILDQLTEGGYVLVSHKVKLTTDEHMKCIYVGVFVFRLSGSAKAVDPEILDTLAGVLSDNFWRVAVFEKPADDGGLGILVNFDARVPRVDSGKAAVEWGEDQLPQLPLAQTKGLKTSEIRELCIRKAREDAKAKGVEIAPRPIQPRAYIELGNNGKPFIVPRATSSANAAGV